MKDSITVIICAYNEEKTIKWSISAVAKTVGRITSDYEILVVNDGSQDQTAKEIKEIARENKKIKVLNHRYNLGFGRAFRTGIQAAGKNYIAGYPSDADLPIENFKNIIAKRKDADIVSSYLTNMDDRSLLRKSYSKLFVFFMNFLFGLNLHYFNGYFITHSNKLKKLDLKSEGFTLFAEVKIKLVKKGATIEEVPILFAPRKYGKSKALTGKSIIQAIKVLPTILKDIYFN